jgi:hypothetical protein
MPDKKESLFVDPERMKRFRLAQFERDEAARLKLTLGGTKK